MARVVANRYEIEDEIGRGGMAVVYRARDMRLHRAVALKLLHPFLATQAESSERFLREAEAIAKLHHPNIVEVFDTGQDEETGSQFIVMELIDGPTLTSFIQNNRLVIPEIALAIGCSLCDAVSHAHAAKIIHRDIKPENIMISSSGVPKLMDFGIARILDAERMTASGSIIGSPAHMAPEIIEGQRYSYTCDIFSLGTVIYFALTGELPFKGATPMAVFKAILDNNYLLPSRNNLTINKKIDRIVQKCLKVSAAERYQTAAELKAAMMDVLRAVHFELYEDVLSHYYAEPAAFNAEMLPAIKNNLLDETRQAIRLRQIPSAVQNLNTVLAYEPENKEAILLLERIRTGSMIKHRLLVCAVCLIILAGLGMGVWLYLDSDEPSTDGDIADAQVTANPDDSTEIAQNDVAETPRDALENQYVAINLVKDEYGFGSEKYHSPDFALQENVAGSHPVEAADAPPSEEKINQARDDQKISNDARPRENGHKPVNKNGRVKTPKKTQEFQQSVNGETSQKPVVGSPAQPEEKTAVDEPQPIQITQPVFPFDAYVFVNGKQYDADSNGNIELSLLPGRYKMTATCKKRCVSQNISFSVSAGAEKITRDVVTLDWADATLTVSASRNDVYFVAIRLDGKGSQVSHLLPNVQTPFNGFNTFGNRPIKLDVYEIPKAQRLNGYDAATLEKSKVASTRIELLPGDNRTVTF